MYPRLIFMLFVVIISGCAATPDQVRATEPPTIFENSKTVESVLACFMERYDGSGISTNQREIIPRADGGKTLKQLVQRNPTIIMFIVDISPTSKGSIVKLYENHLKGFGFGKKFAEICGNGRFNT